MRQMLNCIIGVIGHVDHGKTALIKALTGNDTDRLAEERKRKITIDLGFTALSTHNQDETLAIIDVPGHKDYLKNMLAGASGIDFVLLVVALDEGVMPQTKQHFNIIKSLNARSGIVVLTKSDLVVDDLQKQKVYDEVCSLTEDTFMNDVPRIEVSCKDRGSIDRLREMILESVRTLPAQENRSFEHFHMPIDRVFTLEGRGTVVTGSVLDGSCSVGDTLYLYPGSVRAKVRSVQTCNHDEDGCSARQRVAFNLPGIDKSSVKRGDVLLGRQGYPTSSFILCKIKTFKSVEFKLKNNAHVYISIGAARYDARIQLLDNASLSSGDSSYAAIYIKDSYPFFFKERFILQEMSGGNPIGSGFVLDINPLKPKRNDANLTHYLDRLSATEHTDNILGIINHFKHEFLSVEEISLRLNASKFDVSKSLEDLAERTCITKIGERYVSPRVLDILYHDALIIFETNKSSSLHNHGIPKATFLHKIQELYYLPNKQLGEWFEYSISAGMLLIESDAVYLPGVSGHSTNNSDNDDAMIINFLESKEYKGIKLDDMDELNLPNTRSVINRLVQEGKVVKLTSDLIMSKKYFDCAFDSFQRLADGNLPVSLPQFRDDLGISRKPAQMLLEAFDVRGLTMRDGDLRHIKHKA